MFIVRIKHMDVKSVFNSIALYLYTYRKKKNLDQDYKVECLKHFSYVIGKNYMLYILFNNKYMSISHNCHALI